MLGPAAIDEFRKITSAPEIAPIVVDGLRKADEKSELEPALMKIVGEVDETPHGPMEIADITTVHLRVFGKAVVAAIVIKGRARRKVRAADVAHQLQRGAAFPGVDLLILAAVGDIQDDAKDGLARLAGWVDADWLILDRSDLARLLAAYGELCPRDGSWLGGNPCPTCGNRRPTRAQTTRPPYTVLSLEDTSFATARRYGVHLLVPPGLVEAEVEARLRAAVPGLRHQQYSNSHGAAVLGDRLADVLWVYVYEDVADRPYANWICRALWVSPDLDPRFAPLSFGDPDPLDPALRIEWSTIHEAVAVLLADRLDKGPYLRDLDRYVLGVGVLIDRAASILAEPALTVDGDRALQDLCERIDRLPRPDQSKFPPHELTDLDETFGGVEANAATLGLIFSARGRGVWPEASRRQWLGRKTIADYGAWRAKLAFERARVR